MKPIHSHTLSGRGEQPEQFRVRLAGVAVDSEDRMLAVGDREVKRFSRNGKLQLRFPTRDAGWSIAVDGDHIWVGMQGAVDQFDLDGRPQKQVEDHDRLGRVTALAVRSGVFFAADATNRTIHLYRDGVWQREVGAVANTRGFMIPNGVLDLALEPRRESFLVAHPQKHRVERYGWDGELVDVFGRFGAADPSEFGGCCNPTNVVASFDDLIVVSEKAPPCLKVYRADGAFVTQLDSSMFDPNAKNIDLAVDRRGRLYATDPVRCVIEAFDLEANVG